jgi:glycerol-3-phosphate dehydrogenase (NAD(P)+)
VTADVAAAGRASTPSLGVLGAGAWGTALAQTLHRSGRAPLLWARDPGLIARLAREGVNEAYLPGVRLDPGLALTADLADVARCDVLLLVVPAQQTRALAERLAPLVRPGTPIVLCAKGIERTSGARLSQVVAEVLPEAIPVVLSGPSFAADVVRGLPTALTLATADATLGERLASVIGDTAFRLYWTDDLIGVELGGAVKNVLAIAAGILEGRKLGASAHAALVTRGFAELRRFAEALGGRPQTLTGLSGLGDLLLTCSSPQSRNMSLGRALGEGRNLDDILGARRAVSEGVHTAGIVADMARRLNLDMPISAAVAGIVSKRIDVDAAISGLLTRPFKAED